MISDDHKRLLTELGKNQYGRALNALIDIELEKLDNEKYQEVEKYWAREMTKDLMNKIFSFLNRTSSQVDKKKQMYN